MIKQLTSSTLRRSSLGGVTCRKLQNPADSSRSTNLSTSHIIPTHGETVQLHTGDSQQPKQDSCLLRSCTLGARLYSPAIHVMQHCCQEAKDGIS